MATKMTSVSGSYDKSVPDSGDKQDKKKFTKSINQPTDKFKKPTDKGQGTKWSGTGRNKDQHPS